MNRRPFLYISDDSFSINYRLLQVENQLIQADSLFDRFRDWYLRLFNACAEGYDVRNDLDYLEHELRELSSETRRGCQTFVQDLMAQHQEKPGAQSTQVQLDTFVPNILPDGPNEDGGPWWDFGLDTPLRWRNCQWNPPTIWLPWPAGIPQGPFQPGNNAIAPQGPFQPGNNAIAPQGPFQSGHNAIAPRRPFQAFNPSRIMLGERQVISPQFLALAQRLGHNFNENYRGEISDRAISNAGCPPEENCSLFIVNVDVNVTAPEFFGLIHEGAVASFHRMPPTEGIDTCAVTLAFTTREAAEAYFDRCNQNPGIEMHGRRFRTTWNRERVRPVPVPTDGRMPPSRVLHITGPSRIVNTHDLLDFFAGKMRFTCSGTREHVDARSGRTEVEIAFGSIIGQSKMAMKLFHEDWKHGDLPGGHECSINYAQDPCAPELSRW